MSQREIMRNALLEYVRKQIREGRNQLSAEQWVTVLNSYAAGTAPEECAANAGIGRTEASLLYCRLSIAVTEYALAQMRPRFS